MIYRLSHTSLVNLLEVDESKFMLLEPITEELLLKPRVG